MSVLVDHDHFFRKCSQNRAWILPGVAACSVRIVAAVCACRGERLYGSPGRGVRWGGLIECLKQSIHLSIERVERARVRDHEVGTLPLSLARPLGTLTRCENRLRTSRGSPPRGAAARNQAHRQTRCDRRDHPSRPRAEWPRQARPDGEAHGPSRALSKSPPGTAQRIRG